MIIRCMLNYGVHLAGGIALGACALIAAKYVMDKARPAGQAEPAPQGGAAAPPAPPPTDEPSPAI